MKKILSFIIKSILTLNIIAFPFLYFYTLNHNFYLEHIILPFFLLFSLLILCYDQVILVIFLPVLFIEIIIRESCRTFRNSLIISELKHNLKIWKKHWKNVKVNYIIDELILKIK